MIDNRVAVVSNYATEALQKNFGCVCRKRL